MWEGVEGREGVWVEARARERGEEEGRWRGEEVEEGDVVPRWEVRGGGRAAHRDMAGAVMGGGRDGHPGPADLRWVGWALCMRAVEVTAEKQRPASPWTLLRFVMSECSCARAGGAAVVWWWWGESGASGAELSRVRWPIFFASIASDLAECRERARRERTATAELSLGLHSFKKARVRGRISATALCSALLHLSLSSPLSCSLIILTTSLVRLVCPALLVTPPVRLTACSSHAAGAMPH